MQTTISTTTTNKHIFSKAFLFTFVLATFFLLFSSSTYAIEDTFFSENLKKEIRAQEISKISIYQERAPLIEKSRKGEDTLVQNSYGKIEFENRDINTTDIYINKNIVAVSGQTDTKARVSLYIGEPNKVVGIYKYHDITNDIGEVIEKGKLYTMVRTDEEGYANFRTKSFSSIVASLPDPVTTGIDNNRIELFDLDNYFADYDTVQVFWEDPETMSNVDIGVSYDEGLPFFTTDWYTADNYEISLSPNSNGSGFDLQFRTRTINTSYSETIEDILVRVGKDNGSVFETISQTIDWTIQDINTTPNAPTIDTQFEDIYYLEKGDTLYFADLDVYFENYTSIEIFTEDPHLFSTVWLEPVFIGSSDSSVYTKSYVQMLLQDFASVIDYEVNNQNSASAIGDIYTILVRANNSVGITEQEFNIQMVGVGETPTEEYNLTNGIVSFWDFNEGSGTTASDSVGSNDGTLNLSSWTSSANALLGDSAMSSGNAFANMGGASTLDFAGNMTFIGWFYFDSVIQQALLSNGWGTSTFNYLLYLLSADDKLSLSFGNGGTGTTVIKSASTMNSSQWIMIGFTRNTNDNIGRLYVNGVLENSTSIASHLGSTNGDHWTLGAYNGAGFDSVQGRIDESGVWNIPFSDEDMLTAYADGVGLSYDNLSGGGELSIGEVGQIASFDTPYELYGSNLTEFTFNGFYANYTNISLTFDDDIQSQTGFIQTSKTGSSAVYNYDHITIRLDPLTSDIRLRITSKNYDFGTNITINASNSLSNVQNVIELITYNTTETEIEENASPTQIASIANQELNISATYDINPSLFFTNYNFTSVEYIDPDSAEIVIVPEGTSTETNTYFSIQAFVNGTYRVTNLGGANELIQTFKIVTENLYGTTNDTFTITMQPAPPPPSWLQNFTSLIESWYPDEEDLTLAQQLTYVILTMIITLVLGAVLMFNTADDMIKKIVLSATGVLTILEVFFFIAIGYIPVVIAVLIGLLGAYITYFFIRRGTQG